MGVLEKVEFADWAAPIIPVLKDDGNVRICGDYKMTINKASKVDLYPVQRVEDLFTAMSGGVSFSKLDLSHAYLQRQLEESSRQYVTINTHRGLYRYTRLLFGVSSAPGIFQRAMDNLMQGMPSVVAYLNDILISGRSEQEHLDNLECVLKKLSEAGMRLMRKKCLFMLPEVDYLGHRISKEGIKPTEKRSVQSHMHVDPTMYLS